MERILLPFRQERGPPPPPRRRQHRRTEGDDDDDAAVADVGGSIRLAAAEPPPSSSSSWKERWLRLQSTRTQLRRKRRARISTTTSALSSPSPSLFLVVLLLFSAALFAAVMIPTAAATRLIVTVEPFAEECFQMRIGGTSARPPKSAATRKDGPIKVVLRGNFEQIDDGSVSGEPLVVHVVQEPLHHVEFDQDRRKVVYQSNNEKRGEFRVEVELDDVKPASGDADAEKKRKRYKYWLCIQNHKQHPLGEEVDDDAHADERDRVVGITYNIAYENRDGIDPWQAALAGAADLGGDEKPIPGPVRVESYTKEWIGKSQGLRMQLKLLIEHLEYMKIREADHRQVTEKTFNDVLTWSLIEAAFVLSVVRTV